MLGTVQEHGKGFKIRFVQFRIPRTNALYVFPIIISRSKEGSYRCNRVVDKLLVSSLNPTNRKVNMNAFLPSNNDWKLMEEEPLPLESADHLLEVLSGVTTQLKEVEAKILFATLKISEDFFSEEPKIVAVRQCPQPIGLQTSTTIANITAEGLTTSMPLYIDDIPFNGN